MREPRLPRSAPPAGDYAEETQALRSDDPEVRRALASDADTKPEVLFFLAEDPEPGVRRAIAGNPGAPVHAQLVLARDDDTSVRAAVAERVGGMAGALPAPANHGARLIQVFQTLAADQLPTIRTMVSEALAEVTGRDDPELKEIVKRLALDEVLAVATPALERSSILDDADLIALIDAGIAEGGLSAIARRENLGAGVADAVVSKGDNQAICALLSNRSAQIREETLDAILDVAPGVEEWHEPLIGRPRLSPEAARRVAGFVATSLLEVLRQRNDLDPATADAVAEAVRVRVKDGVPRDAAGWETPFDRAARLHGAGELSENVVERAIAAGDRAFVNAALAVRSGLPMEVVRDMLASKSGKAVIALAWKAGFAMRLAIQLQARIAAIPPSGIMMAHEAGDFPLKDQDMEWQVAFFGG